MELDQLIFKKVSNFISKVRNKPTEQELERTVYLEANRGIFTILAQALTGQSIKIITAEREGGYRDNVFFLPAKFSLLPTKDHNEQLYWFRIFYLSTAFNHRHLLKSKNENFSIPQQHPLNQRLLELLFEEFPVFKTIHSELIDSFKEVFIEKQTEEDYSWLYGKWMMNSNDDKEANIDTPNDITKKGLPTPKTEIKAKPVDEVSSIQVNKKEQQDYTLMHNFEKIETAEEFNGTWRDFDGDDQLEEHQEALEQITMRHTVRVDDETHSVYQSEFISNAQIPDSKQIPESGLQCFSYDEWDQSKLMYRKNYCRVYASKASTSDKTYIQNTLNNNGKILRHLKKEFANFFNKLAEIKRLNQGEILNTDILTDVISDIRAGKTPTDKVYNSKRKQTRDLSILFLLDLSLSADGYTGGNRIIDVEKQIAILMGELLESYDIPFQIDGFSSKTRNYCSYTTFKSFTDSWQTQKDIIGGIVPEGYTRIGPALRHAKTLMKNQDTRKKWIVILSDGKPNDFDKYEGVYGIADIKQALRELEQNHIHTHTFAIEEKAKYYLPQIFGAGNHNILSNPKEMLISMTHLCQRIITT